MTEEEWRSCTKPLLVLHHLRDTLATRKFRLFADACCQRTQRFIVDERIEQARQLLGRSTDEVVPEEQLSAAEHQIRALASENVIGVQAVLFALFVANDKVHTQYYTLGVAAVSINDAVSCRKGLKAKHVRKIEERWQVPILRDIFGNPFRPAGFSSEWRSDTAVTLARQMYESREFGAMPILADALQDVGCDNEHILSHCRGDAPHVRGCWVVDLVLGKV
jgi:hypothetical protein